MRTLVVGWRDVTKLLTMTECVEVMRGTFRALARGEVVLPLRQIVWQPDRKGALALMPAYVDAPGALGVKAVTFFPGNQDSPYESHQGAVLLFEKKNGRLLAIIDASSVTATRTAAVSGVATDVMARKDVRTLGILGSGTQAETHLKAMLAIRRGVSQVRVWSRNKEHAREFVQRESKKYGVSMEVVGSAEEAVRGADLICTVTASTSPILKGGWLSPGAHVNAVGSSAPPFRELDSEAVARGSFFVDSRESALNEADDFRIPKREGLVGEGHIRGELGEVVVGKVPGRTFDAEITIFKSLGLAVEDLTSAHYIYTRAAAANLGTWVELNPERRARWTERESG